MKSNLLTAFAVVFIGCVLSVNSMAQSTTSAIRGKVIDEQGQPVSGASVVVTDTRTGSENTLSSNSAGSFLASNLVVGGPYLVEVNGTKSVTVDSVELGDIYSLTIEMASSVNIEEIIVLGESADIIDVASGPAATFSSFDIETAVSLNRDIKDVYFIDPRLNIDEPDGGSSLNCVGKHPRFNSITLDGVSQDDRFGLNSNGYSTATGMPFPYDAISQVAVELAPFDPSYGGFSACNINAVTRSGSNEWTGNVFYEWGSDSLRGDEVDGIAVDNSQSYSSTSQGFTLGGPVIEDKLFLYVAYEESEEPEFIAQGYAGSGSGEERDWLSEADYNRIRQIAIDLYDYDPGEQPSNGAQTQEKLLVKLDLEINEDHSASLVYNSYEGLEDRASDSDDDEFEFSNHFYQKGAEISSTSLFVNSQWTDSFSTELFINESTMDDSQITVGPTDFAEVQITMPGFETVYLGADDSRQANALNTESSLIKLSGQFLVGDHVITAGFQTEELTIFNQFVQHAQGGEIRFDSIDDFEAGTPARYYYGSGGGSNDADDAAAQFSNRLNTFFIQDEFILYDYDLTITAGLRYDYFTSSDSPTFNQNFFDENGVRNDVNIDGLDLLMPRLGFTWEADDRLTVRGGLGLFSGGNPNVWLSNAWSNDGISNVQLQNRYNAGESLFSDIDLIGSDRPGYDVPQDMFDAVAAIDPALGLGATGRIVLIDPNYEQPSEWKYSLGATYLFDNGISADVDLLYSVQNDAAHYVDLSQEIVGTTILDQPIYDFRTTNYTGEDNHMLTNSSEDASSFTFSAIFNKAFDSGLSLTAGYAYTEAEDISPMTSSTAGSNFDNTATLDINNLVAGTSNYETPHRFTFRATYGKEFFDGYSTRFTTTFVRKSGQPQSYVMQGLDLEGDGFFGRHLLYIPTGIDDPNVIFDPGFDSDAFFAWADDNGLSSGFTSRNGSYSKWSNRMDFRFDQEIPGFIGDATGNLFFKMNNVLNFIDSDWGAQYDNEFFSQRVVSGGVDDTTGQYVYESFSDRDVTDLLDTVSVWEATMGVEFKF